MIVVSDTSPIRYLILIGQINLLAQLYGQVTISETVRQELLNERSPIPVRKWITAPPDWLVVRSLTAPISEELEGLDVWPT